jgi:histidine triad (HIT) family protein
MENCIFCKIVAKTLPTQIIYEDDNVIVFNDIYPKAEVHLLVIPKKHIPSLLETSHEDQELLGKLLVIAIQQAKNHGLINGFKTQINSGAMGGQEIDHLHLHVFGNKN